MLCRVFHARADVYKEDPLSHDLKPVKLFLDDYVQTLVQHGNVDERALTNVERMFVEPAVTIIRGTIECKLQAVKSTPQFYSDLVEKLGVDDCQIYSAIFRKEVKKGEPAYRKMLLHVARLYTPDQFTAKRQPTANQLELSVLVKEVAHVKDLTANIDGVSVTFRSG